MQTQQYWVVVVMNVDFADDYKMVDKQHLSLTAKLLIEDRRAAMKHLQQKRRVLLANRVSCRLFTCLNSILKGAGQKEKGCRMLEPLLAQQRKGIFQRCFPPPVLAEVVPKEVCHFGILLGPCETEISCVQNKNFYVVVLHYCDRI